MTPLAYFRAAGQALYGPRWQAPLAGALGVNRRSVARWLAGEWPVPEGVAAKLRRLLAERRGEIDALLAS